MQKVELRKGPWLEQEDEQLAAAVAVLGARRWDALAKTSGLRRNGKSCRLRWMNYLRPNLRHGNISEDEEKIIVKLHDKLGNKWSEIARRLPGRTDNEIKNYWRSHSRKKGVVSEKECCSNATNASLISECDTASLCSIDNDQWFLIKDDISGPFDDSSGSMLEMLSWTRSPFEMRLKDWMFDYDISNPRWNSVDCNSNYSTWDVSLWDGQ